MQSLGADHVIDYTRDVAAEVRKIVASGVDAALPTVPAAESSALHATRDGGRITWINNAFETPLERGIAGTETNGSHGTQLLDALTSLVEQGALKVHIDRKYALEDAGQAQADVAAGHVRGKLVIDIAG